jgi:hypothetical protein
LRLWQANKERFRALTAPFSETIRARTWDAMAEEIADVVGEAGVG